MDGGIRDGYGDIPLSFSTQNRQHTLPFCKAPPPGPVLRGTAMCYPFDMDTRWCNYCKTTKDLTDFPQSSSQKNGHSYTCKECCVVKMKIWNKKRRRELMEMLCGGKPRCVTCMYADIRALVFDHINNDAQDDTPSGRATGPGLFKVVEKTPRRFQVLCQNCNAIKQFENSTNMHINRRMPRFRQFQPIKPFVIVRVDAATWKPGPT